MCHEIKVNVASIIHLYKLAIATVNLVRNLNVKMLQKSIWLCNAAIYTLYSGTNII